jgi:23S rRNA (cytosine1962-C5)-methyltransferase
MSIKLLRQGHPWVTLDSFSRRFPDAARFVVGQDDRKMDVGILLHDPRHKQVRGRLWSTERPWDEKKFWAEVETRLAVCKTRRECLPSFQARDNRYWIFGEADQLPGLVLLQLADRYVLQCYALVWQDLLPELIPRLQKIWPGVTNDQLWVQTRSEDGHGQRPPEPYLREARQDVFTVNENGLKLIARLGETYDYGLYSDMAAVRFALNDLIKESPRVLNLYSYSGAFSLQALKLGAAQVVSVDLSAKYLGWLQDNIKANDETWQERHRSLKLPTEEALKLLRREGAHFDLIISDPPSASSDGQKRTSALQAYEDQAEDLLRLLAPGGKILSFLNTHTVSAQRFENHMKPLFSAMKIQRRFGLVDDCPTVKGFPEGHYLKGVLWT